MKTIPNIMRKLFLLTLMIVQVVRPDDSCMPGKHPSLCRRVSEQFEAATGISAFAGIAIGAAAWTVSTAAFMYATWRHQGSKIEKLRREKEDVTSKLNAACN